MGGKGKKKNYEHNDHLFKLNRSTKSSSVLVNCLQSALFHFVDGDRATFRSVEQVIHIFFPCLRLLLVLVALAITCNFPN